MGAILALLVLIVALFSILWSPPNVEHFELWLIVALALAILLGGGLGGVVAEVRSWRHPPSQ
jgi:hypothetical protein